MQSRIISKQYCIQLINFQFSKNYFKNYYLLGQGFIVVVVVVFGVVEDVVVVFVIIGVVVIIGDIVFVVV